MRNPRDVDALLFATESTGAKMVFIDTFNRAMGSGWNENNNADVSAMRETQERIRSELGATVIAIHHPAKDATGSGLRGHSSLYDDPSFVIRLEEKGGIIKVDHSKMRNGPRITIGRYELVDVTPAPGRRRSKGHRRSEPNQPQRKGMVSVLGSATRHPGNHQDATSQRYPGPS